MSSDIAKLEEQILELTRQLAELRAEHAGEEVRNYSFETSNGPATLLHLFGAQDKRLVIHNMGQGCR